MIDLDEIKAKQEMADLCEMTSEELEKRASRLLKKSRELLGMATQLRADTTRTEQVADQQVSQDRTLNRFGDWVDEVIAIKKAEELQSFTFLEWMEALGLNRAQGRKWLTKLMRRKYPIVERRADNSYCYVEPPDNYKQRPREPTPEQLAMDPHARLGRGQAVERSATQRARMEDLSKPGRRHQIKQAEKRFQRLRAAAANRNGKE